MANKINVKLILQLRDEGLGRNAIAFSRHIGKSSVSDVFAIADKMGIKYSDVITGLMSKTARLCIKKLRNMHILNSGSFQALNIVIHERLPARMLIVIT